MKSPRPSAKRPKRRPAATVLDQELVSSLSEVLTRAELGGLLGRAEGQLSALTGSLRRAWTRRSLTATERNAHKLAGLAGTIGCARVMATARKIEIACRNGTRRRVQALFVELERRLPPAVAALDQWRAHIEGEPG